MWLTHLPGHHLTLLTSYINCSYLTCSSLVCISNKILPFCPFTCLWTPHGLTHARDAGLHPRPVYLLIGYRSHNCHHPSDDSHDLLALHWLLGCKLYSLYPMCLPITLVLLPTSVSDQKNQSWYSAQVWEWMQVSKDFTWASKVRATWARSGKSRRYHSWDSN